MQYQLFGRREKEDFLLKDDDAAPVKPVAQPDPTLANSEEAHSSSEHRSSLVPPSGTTVPPPLVDEKDQAIIAADRPLSYITEATKISEIK